MMFPLVSLARSSSVHSNELSSMIASMRFGYLKRRRDGMWQISIWNSREWAMNDEPWKRLRGRWETTRRRRSLRRCQRGLCQPPVWYDSRDLQIESFNLEKIFTLGTDFYAYACFRLQGNLFIIEHLELASLSHTLRRCAIYTYWQHPEW